MHQTNRYARLIKTPKRSNEAQKEKKTRSLSELWRIAARMTRELKAYNDGEARAFCCFYSFASFNPTATHLTHKSTAAAASMLVAENSCNPINLPPSCCTNAPAMGDP